MADDHSRALEDLFERLERERLAADREYNDALTALDRAFQEAPELPQLPLGVDPTALTSLNEHWKIVPEGGPPFGRSLKGRLSGFVWRVVGPLLQAQQRFNAGVVDHLHRNLAAAQDRQRALERLLDIARRELGALVRFEWLLLQFLQTITAYVDTKDRAGGTRELQDKVSLLQSRVMSLEHELSRRIEAAGRSLSSAPPATAPSGDAAFASTRAATYVGFEDRFRGTPDEIRRRLEVYVPVFRNRSRVIDIGCGRGELLDLFRERNIPAIGIDANQAMVDVCRERGLEAVCADALGYLNEQPDASLGGLVAIQVVEHLEPAYLMRFLETAYQKLSVGSPLVLETVNVASWMAYFECYMRDLTHVRPLHPDTLRYLLQASGFSNVNVEFRQPVAAADRLERVDRSLGASDAAVDAVVTALNDHADKLNARLFAPMDYAVVARR